ncbi:MAG TPA: hypothetical protein VFL04_05865, partial [Rectinemataceae bacterium]|nr:hypothetical protein [Rectinemataceae bacterium]
IPSAFDDSQTASRIMLTLTNVAAGELWLDELLLEDSRGRAALMFQGDLAYSEPELSLGGEALPIVHGLELRADAAGAVQDGSFASGGLFVGTALGPLGVEAQARGSAASGSSPTLHGGHALIFPSGGSPLRGEDRFDYNPQTGAFGREDSVSLNAGGLLSLTARQRTAWSPSASSLESGLLDQVWEGRLGAGSELLALSASAANRVRPASWTDLPASYGPAWIAAFRYALPAYQAQSERREEKAGLSLRAGDAGEFASLSMGTVAEPTAAGGADRQLSAAGKLSLPLDIGGVRVAPYYQRSWRDRRPGSAASLVGDLNTALDDLSSARLAYAGRPLSELSESRTRQEFEDQTAVGSDGLPFAFYAPELGLTLSRDFGSNWYDLLVPSSLSLARRRELERDASTVSDSAVWDSDLRFGSLNLFGAQGAYPLGLPFDSDEYFASIQASLTKVAGEAAERIKIQAQHLATFYAGEADRLDAENRISVSTQPGSSAWDERIRLSVSRRQTRHWLLDLYRMAVPGATAAAPSTAASSAAAPGAAADQGVSLVSLYLADLQGRSPNLRSIVELDASLSRTVTDAAKPGLTWGLAESYEAKLTVPERLTVSVKGALSQGEDGTTSVVEVDLTLSLAVTISF